MSLATVSIVGNLVKDPEQFSFPSGRTKTRIIVAVNASRANKVSDEADFYKVEAWGKLGDLSASYLTKGNQVTVCGRLVFERWTDKEGRDRRTPLIEANQIAFPRRLKLVDYELESKQVKELDDERGTDLVADLTATTAVMAGRASKSSDSGRASPHMNTSSSGRKAQSA